MPAAAEQGGEAREEEQLPRSRESMDWKCGRTAVRPQGATVSSRPYVSSLGRVEAGQSRGLHLYVTGRPRCEEGEVDICVKARAVSISQHLRLLDDLQLRLGACQHPSSSVRVCSAATLEGVQALEKKAPETEPRHKGFHQRKVHRVAAKPRGGLMCIPEQTNFGNLGFKQPLRCRANNVARVSSRVAVCRTRVDSDVERRASSMLSSCDMQEEGVSPPKSSIGSPIVCARKSSSWGVVAAMSGIALPGSDPRLVPPKLQRADASSGPGGHDVLLAC